MHVNGRSLGSVHLMSSELSLASSVLRRFAHRSIKYYFLVNPFSLAEIDRAELHMAQVSPLAIKLRLI